MTEIKHAYAGEAQLLRWAESLSAGRTVTLRLEEEGDQHPFKGIPAGQRMQIVAVLVNDDEQPIGPEEAKKNSTRHKARTIPAKPEPVAEPEKATGGGVAFKDRPRSQQAGIRCQDQEFQAWLRSRYVTAWRNIPLCDDKPHATATAVLKAALGVSSRTELDEPESPKALAWDRLLTDFDMRHTVRA